MRVCVWKDAGAWVCVSVWKDVGECVCMCVRMCLPDHKNESLFDKIRARVERKKIVKDWKDLEPTGNFPSRTTACLDKALEVKLGKKERKIDRNDERVW